MMDASSVQTRRASVIMSPGKVASKPPKNIEVIDLCESDEDEDNVNECSTTSGSLAPVAANGGELGFELKIEDYENKDLPDGNVIPTSSTEIGGDYQPTQLLDQMNITEQDIENLFQQDKIDHQQHDDHPCDYSDFESALNLDFVSSSTIPVLEQSSFANMPEFLANDDQLSPASFAFYQEIDTFDDEKLLDEPKPVEVINVIDSDDEEHYQSESVKLQINSGILLYNFSLKNLIFIVFSSQILVTMESDGKPQDEVEKLKDSIASEVETDVGQSSVFVNNYDESKNNNQTYNFVIDMDVDQTILSPPSESPESSKLQPDSGIVLTGDFAVLSSAY